MSKFGDTLKSLREERCISVSALAEMTGFARRTIYDWEKGKAVPASFSSREILANIFHVSPFFFDDDFELEEHPVIKNIMRRIKKLEENQNI